MFKKLTLSLFFLLSCTLASAETMTFSTYYPSPSGSYDRLRLVPRSAADLTCDEHSIGVLFFDEGDADDTTDDRLLVCKADGFQSVGGWELDTANNFIYPEGTPTDPETWVGIGTNSPAAELDIRGTDPSIRLEGTGPIYLFGYKKVSGSRTITVSMPANNVFNGDPGRIMIKATRIS